MPPLGGCSQPHVVWWAGDPGGAGAARGRGADPDQVARLIEQLLADPRLRERFRRDPVRVCRSLGLDAIADEMSAGAGKAGETLDLRESRSSLAGVLMAAAVEGIAVAQLLEQARVAGGALAEAAGRVTLPSLPALPDPGGHGAGSSAGSALAAASGVPEGAGDVAAGAPSGAPAGGGGSASPDPVATTPGTPGSTATDADSVVDAGGEPGGTGETRAGSSLPLSATAGAASTSAAPPSPEVAALLDSPRVALDDTARATLVAGRVPAPAVRVLSDLAASHDLGVSVSPIDASAVEITMVDGSPVSAANIDARDLAEHLATLPAEQRPTAIATPWRIDGAPFVHDASVDDRLRLSYAASQGSPGGSPSAASAADAADPADADAAASRAPVPPPPPRPEQASAPTSSSSTDATPAPSPAVDARPAAAPPAGASPAPSTDADDLVFREPTARRAAAGTGDDDELVFRTAGRDTRADRLATPGDPASAAAEVVPVAITDYPGDDAPRDQIAAWMATKARERGLPGELPVMASLVESGMKNLNYGDRDSVGFFQMRTEIWNSGDYEGYPERPDLQLKWFLDHAAEVRAQRLARGQSIDDPHQFGEWIADVERPAEQYRGRYQLRLDEARGLLQHASGGSAGAAAVVEPPAGGASRAAELSPAGATGAAAEVAAHSGTDAATAAAQAVLDNPRIHLDEVGRGDVRAGRMDPRLLALLTRLAQDHDIRISCTKSDHPEFTAGGSVSNHFRGRALDVAFVDGQIVNGGSPKSRALAEHLASLPDAYRPDEIGTPWAIAAPGYFTDADHQDHIHIGFKTELPEGWAPPADVAPTAAPAAPPDSASRASIGGTPVPNSDDDDDLVLRAHAHRERLGDGGEGSRKRSAGDDLSFPVKAPAPTPAEPSAQRLAAEAAPTPAASADAVVPASAAPDPHVATALKSATAELGTPYLWGGSSPKTGFDCSGLVQWAYAQAGIRIPRVAEDQFGGIKGALVDRGHVQAGDLVFFRNAGGEIHHVGMAIDGERFIHAPHTGDVVKISRLDEAYYAGQFAGARRPAGGADALAGRAAIVDPSAAGVSPAEAAVTANAAPAPDAASSSAAPDPTAVRAAEAARIGDARAAADRDSLTFKALSRQEVSSHNDTLQFLAVQEPPKAQRLQAAAADAGLPITAGAETAVPTGYPGDDAGREALARWLGSQARKHGLPAELPVMAALTESGLQNLNYGDRDSVGFFQMRTEIWNKDAYAGYPERPDLQARWFIDQALAVRRARIAAGDATFGRDPSQWGNWIADIERPAEQYRGRYQLRLAEARRLLGNR